MRTPLTFLTGLLFALSAQAGLLDAGFDAEYNVYMAGLYAGVSKRQVTVDGDRIVYRAHTEPRGFGKAFTSDIITEVSRMRRVAGDVQPLEYRYDQAGKDEVHEQVRFDWQAKTLYITKNRLTYPITENTYDMLSFQIAMMLKLARQPTRFTFHVADHHDLHTYQATVVGPEEITTKYQSDMPTIRVDSINRKENLRFSFWCAPALDYLPVRISIVRMDLDIGSLTELKALQIRAEDRGPSGEKNR